uniref:SH3 domain-containing protein n=1 Tax=Timema shepardi TaxID=629360 RepID=A0A7R9FVH8_TIMSH|nr:unnamed protein product [Timema shepardi]
MGRYVRVKWSLLGRRYMCGVVSRRHESCGLELTIPERLPLHGSNYNGRGCKLVEDSGPAAGDAFIDRIFEQGSFCHLSEISCVGQRVRGVDLLTCPVCGPACQGCRLANVSNVWASVSSEWVGKSTLRVTRVDAVCLVRGPVASGVEMTWVVSDHVAAAGSQEITVHKGQQVEVLELRAASPDWCLVRMPTSGTVDSPPEGLVPLSVLKQPPPGLKTSPSRRATADHETETCPTLLATSTQKHLPLSLPLVHRNISYSPCLWCTETSLILPATGAQKHLPLSWLLVHRNISHSPCYWCTETLPTLLASGAQKHLSFSLLLVHRNIAHSPGCWCTETSPTLLASGAQKHLSFSLLLVHRNIVHSTCY